MHFASDNTSGIHPDVLHAIEREATGYDWSYGEDAVTARIDAVFAHVFEHDDVHVFPVLTGTAANALALSVVAPPYGGILCHEVAHVLRDECGAPEFMMGGGRLVPLAGDHGRITTTAVHEALARPGHGVHAVPASALTITQATEVGTVYSPDDIAALADVSHAAGLAVHLDGARLANAVAATGASPADLTWRAGVDVLSFGGTKNGALDAEAVVFFDSDRVADFPYRRKRAGHLPSKMRYLSAQLEALFDDGLWLRVAGHANTMAARLADGLDGITGVRLVHPVEANMVFTAMTPERAWALREAGATFFGEVAGDVEVVRLVTSWSTTEDDVEAFLGTLRAGARDIGS